MAAVGSLRLLLLGLALLHGSAYSICPLAEAALLLPTSEPGHRESLSLVRQCKFDSEVEKALASSGSPARRRLKQDPDSSAVPTAAFPPASGETAPSPPVADVQPPPRVAHTDYVYEGY